LHRAPCFLGAGDDGCGEERQDGESAEECHDEETRL